jgi:hypothetical protein
MVQRFYLVKEEFNLAKEYGIKIRPQYAKCLASLKKGQKINPQEFVKSHLNEFTSKPQSFKSNRFLIYHSFTLGKKIGILQALTLEETGYSTSFDKFCQLDTMKYFIGQMGRSTYKNLKVSGMGGTAESYSYKLWKFNEWLHGKSFEFQISEQKDHETFKRTRKSITLKGLEHFLRLYQDPYKIEQDFIRIIKNFLMDPIHKNKRQKTNSKN